jgi:hypothetical protein
VGEPELQKVVEAVGLAHHPWRMVITKDKTVGIRWNMVENGVGVSEVTAACGGGLKAVLEDHMGFVLGGGEATTLGDLHEFTLGLAGARQWFGRSDGGTSKLHDSKIS